MKLKTKNDPVLKDYFRNLDRFTDIFNLVMFDGIQTYKPENCTLINTDESAVISLDDMVISLQRFRDVLVLYEDNGIKEYLGIENQTTMDNNMSVRAFIYDAVNIIMQYSEYQKETRKKKKKGPMKIKRVRTVCLYYGKRKIGKRHSYMSNKMNIFDKNDNDWHTEYVSIISMDSSKCRNKDNRELIEALKLIYGIDKTDIKKVEEIEVSYEVAIVAATVTNDTRLLEIIKEKEKGERVKMCESLRRFRKTAVNEGLIKGKHEKEIEMLIEILTCKLGSVSESLRKMIQTVSEERLHTLTINIFDVENEKEVIDILLRN